MSEIRLQVEAINLQVGTSKTEKQRTQTLPPSIPRNPEPGLSEPSDQGEMFEVLS